MHSAPVPNIKYLRSTLYMSTALSSSLDETEFKGLKSFIAPLLGIAASIFVPMLAPGIAGIFGGGALAQAAVSTGLGTLAGGAGSALSGGNFGTGALMGGLGALGGQALGGLFGGAGAAGAGAAGAVPIPGANPILTPGGGFAGTVAPGAAAAGAAAGAAGAAGQAGQALSRPGFLETLTGNIGPLTQAGFEALGAAQKLSVLKAAESDLQRLQQQDQAAYEDALDTYNLMKNTLLSMHPETQGQFAVADVARREAAAYDAARRQRLTEGGLSPPSLDAAEARRAALGLATATTAAGTAATENARLRQFEGLEALKRPVEETRAMDARRELATERATALGGLGKALGVGLAPFGGSYGGSYAAQRRGSYLDYLTSSPASPETPLW